MRRRQVLQMMAGGLAVACPLCSALASEAGAPKWSYGGDTGPGKWGALNKDWQVCGAGGQQSPVDLGSPLRAALPPFGLTTAPVEAEAYDNGHTIEVGAAKGCKMTLDGTEYDLLQFHFHAPSEHLIGGRSWPMEVHLVHAAPAGGLAVLGVLLDAGAMDNAAYGKVLDTLPEKGGAKRKLGKLDPVTLLPASRNYYRYAGSLTTPACAEVVNWLVLREPVMLGRRQVEGFAARYPNNARPVQPLNRRFVLTSS